jgi:polyhydroxybutyrate depolymerase
VITTGLTVDGLERTYDLFVPADLPADDPVALVVDIHGLGSDAAGQDDASRFAAKAAAEGFVLAQPNARGDVPTWNPQPGSPGAALDVAFLRALVDDVATRVLLDPGRIYVSGFSNGGGMAHRLACDAADIVAAIGVVSGQYPATEVCDPSEAVAVIAFHGTADLVVGYRGFGDVLPPIPGWAEDWAERDQCAPVPALDRIANDVLVDRWTGCARDVEVQLYTIEGGAHAWPGSDRLGFFAPTQSIDATDLMWDFFASHAKS